MAMLAFDNRLGRAERDERNPEDMKECPGRAGLKNCILATVWALLHAARPVVVAHYLASTEENNHAFPSRIKSRELRTVKAVGS
jgi:hypothetical protein